MLGLCVSPEVSRKELRVRKDLEAAKLLEGSIQEGIESYDIVPVEQGLKVVEVSRKELRGYCDC